MAFEWLIKLNDRFSDPASKVEKSIQRVNHALRDLKAQQKDGQAFFQALLGNTTLANIRLAEADLLRLKNKRAELRQVAGAFSLFNRQSRDGLALARDWAIVLQPIASLMKSVGSFAISTGSALTKSIGQAIGERQDARIGFQAAFGDQSEETLKMVRDLAVRTGSPVGELFNKANNLGNLGAKPDEIRAMLLASDDAKVMGLEVGKLERVFEASFSKPAIKIREVSEGLRGVIDETKLWAHLAEDVGIRLGRKVTVGEVDKMVEHNQIGGGFLRQAVLETFQDKEGEKLGSTNFKRADQTLGGRSDRLEQRFKEIFGNVEKTEGYQNFIGAFDHFLTALDDKKTQKVLDHLANAVGEIFKPFADKEGQEKFDNFFDRIAKGAERVIPLISGTARMLNDLSRRFAPTDKDKKDMATEEAERKRVADELDSRGAKKLADDVGSATRSWFGLRIDPNQVEAFNDSIGDQYTIPKLGGGTEKISAREYHEIVDLIRKGGGRDPMYKPDGTVDYFIEGTQVDKKTFDQNNDIQGWNRPSTTRVWGATPKIDIHVNVDARGATKQDAHAIAKKVKDASAEGLADVLHKINTESP